MTPAEALALLRANPPHEESPLPWRVNGKFLEDSNGEDVAGVGYRDDAKHIAAAVNAAPVLLAELDAVRERERWIPVGERLPEHTEFDDDGAQTVDVLVGGKRICNVFISSNGEDCWGWFLRDGGDDVEGEVTHWRPLPPPPEVSP